MKLSLSAAKKLREVLDRKRYDKNERYEFVRGAVVGILEGKAIPVVSRDINGSTIYQLGRSWGLEHKDVRIILNTEEVMYLGLLWNARDTNRYYIKGMEACVKGENFATALNRIVLEAPLVDVNASDDFEKGYRDAEEYIEENFGDII